MPDIESYGLVHNPSPRCTIVMCIIYTKTPPNARLKKLKTQKILKIAPLFAFPAPTQLSNTMNTLPPMTPLTSANVKKPAETFSAVVAGVVSIILASVPGLLTPALGSP